MKAMPTVEVWKDSSSGGIFASRASEPTLTRIDALMAIHESKSNVGFDNQYDRHLCRCEIFYAIEAWLKDFDKDKKNKTKIARSEGVNELYAAVADNLADWYGTTVNVLPNELEEHFGKAMVEHGATTDAKWLGGDVKKIHKTADDYMAKATGGKFKGEFKDPLFETFNPVYKSRAEAEQYRVFFKAGVAYQMPWWDDKSKDGALVKLDTVKYFKKETMSKDGRAGFVLSMDRDLYIAQHFVNRESAFYHSSYLAGGKVQCAGELRCIDGKFTMVSNYSGHYQPKQNHLLNLVETLKTQGCDLKKTLVLVLTGLDANKNAIVDKYKAEDFLKKKGKMADDDKLALDDAFVKAAV